MDTSVAWLLAIVGGIAVLGGAMAFGIIRGAQAGDAGADRARGRRRTLGAGAMAAGLVLLVAAAVLGGTYSLNRTHPAGKAGAENLLAGGASPGELERSVTTDAPRTGVQGGTDPRAAQAATDAGNTSGQVRPHEG